MHKLLAAAGVSVLLGTLAACSSGTDTIAGHIRFAAHTMQVNVPGQPSAQINADGALAFGGRSVAVTTTQRATLQQYYAQARKVEDLRHSISHQSIHLAAHAVGDAVASLAQRGSHAASERMDADGTRIAAEANALCGQIKSLAAAQSAVAHALPAFVPYAKGNPLQCTVTHTMTYRFGGTSVSSSSTSFVEHAGSASITASTKIVAKADGSTKVDLSYEGQHP